MNREHLEAAHNAARARGEELRTKIDELDAASVSEDDLSKLESDLADAVAEVERTRENLNKRIAQDKVLDADPVRVPEKKEPARARGSLSSELIYRPDATTADASFFRDLTLAKNGDARAYERLERSNREVFASDSGVQMRAGINQTATSGGEFVPPVWLNDMYAPLYRAGRPFVDALGAKPLPPGTNSINLPKITTGDSVAVQTDGNSVSNTDLVTTSVSAQVQTEAGRAVASYQVVDLGQPALEAVLYQDLLAAYNANLDLNCINGAVTNAKGVLNQTGINAVTYTSASPKGVSATVADSAWNQVIFAKNAIEKNGFVPVDMVVTHPSFWNWFLSTLDTQTRPLAIANTGIGGFNAVAGYNPGDYPSAPTIAGNIAGLPVVVDPNVPVNLGGGTNETRVIALSTRGFDIWEGVPRFKVADQTSISTLQYQFVLYNYYAVASRQPKMVSVIAGTGMIIQSGY